MNTMPGSSWFYSTQGGILSSRKIQSKSRSSKTSNKWTEKKKLQSEALIQSDLLSRSRRCLSGPRRTRGAPSVCWGRRRCRWALYWRSGSPPTAACRTSARSRPSGLPHSVGNRGQEVRGWGGKGPCSVQDILKRLQEPLRQQPFI